MGKPEIPAGLVLRVLPEDLEAMGLATTTMVTQEQTPATLGVSAKKESPECLEEMELEVITTANQEQTQEALEE